MRKISNKIFSLFSVFSILVQTLSGIILYSPVYAEDTTPTPEPTVTVEQVVAPTEEPASPPTVEPTNQPTVEPISQPTVEPTSIPTETITPTVAPTETAQPSPEPTSSPTPEVTVEPTVDSETMIEPTATPTPESLVLGNQNENGPPDPALTDSPTDQSSAQLVFSVSTDLADYAPESIIKISGTGYQPNQNLTIRVTWPDNTVRGSGNLPGFTDSTIANEKGELYFEYQLTGGQDGSYKLEVLDSDNNVLATTTFTDSRTIVSATLNGAASVSVAPSESVTASITVNAVNPGNKDWKSTDWRIDTGSPICVNHPNHADGTFLESFPITAPSSAGSYSISFTAYKDDGCSQEPSGVVTLSNGIVVVADVSPTLTPTLTLTPTPTSIPAAVGANIVQSSQLLCTIDVDGANDQPGQKDITKMCVDDSGNPIQVIFDWDEVMGGGNNTYDGCSLWDNNGNGNADFALCVSVLANPVTDTMEYHHFTLYSCGDNKSDRCSQQVNTLSPSAGTECNASQQGTDPFPASVLNGPGAAYPQDTVGICNINSTDVGGSTTVLLNVCSFPSGQPNSDPSDCVGRPTGGFITINKVANPNDGTTFNFTISGVDTYNPSINGSGTSNRYSVSSGTYSVSETIPSGWSLSSASCVDQAGATKGTFGGNAVTGISVTSGADIVCTFNDDLSKGTLLVHKTYTDQANLPVTINVSNAAGAVDSKQTTAGDASFSLVPGTYSAVVAQEPAGYHEQSNNCVDKVVTAGQTTQCTIVNTPDTGSLTLTKSNANSVNPANWTFNVSGPGGYSNTGVTSGTTLTGLPLGTYTITETGPANYHYVSGSGTGCSFASDGTLTVEIDQNGDSFSCTYTNAPDNGSISGIKFNDVDGDSLDKETGEAGLSGWTIEVRDLAGALVGSATTAADGSYNIGDLVPGTYSVCELTQSPEWTRTYPGADCYTGVVIGPGGQITGKNFGNFQNVDIAACKNVDSDGDGQIDDPYTDGWLMTLKKSGVVYDSQSTGRDGCYTWTNLGPGSYSVEEETKTGWTPVGSTTHDFGIVSSGTPYSHTFGNFENVSITACKLTDADGLIGTTGDRGAKADWPVYLTIDTVRQVVQYTGENGCYTWTDLGPGHAYGVEEDVLTGWTALTPTTHSFGQPTSGNSTYSYNFINTALGTIIIEKQTDPDEDETDFTFSGDVAGQIADDEQLTASNRLPGQYTVTETVVAGWNLTDISCDDGESTGSLATKTATINLQAGETVTCTFTNTKYAKLTAHKFIDKNTNGILDGTDSNYTYGDISMELYLGSDCQGTKQSFANTNGTGNVLYQNLAPGDYSVKEVMSPGADWKNSTPICQNVTLDAGEEEQLNFGNYPLGTIYGFKYNDLNGNGLANPGEPVLAGWTINLVGPNGYSESRVTDAAGYVLFEGLDYGTYTYSEVMQAGWAETIPAGGRTYSFTVDYDHQLPAGSSGFKITNFSLGTISGVKFDDLNGNGQKDAEEPGLSGWTINLDKDANGLVEDTEVTGADGQYQFTGLAAGTYRVREQGQTGWTQTTANLNDILIQSGTNSVNNNFGNFKFGEIKACKYEDLNGNGNKDTDDPALANINILLYKQGDGWGVVDNKDTGEDGCVIFDGLTVGQYKVEENLNDPDLIGYYQSFSPQSYPYGITSGSNYTDSESMAIFLNAKYRTISGQKFNDINGNGVQNASEPGLEGWEIYIDSNFDGDFDAGETKVLTDANGNYEFSGLVSDLYRIREVIKSGWTQTMPVAGYYDADVHANYTSTGNNFGNYQFGRINVCKFDDQDGDGDFLDEDPSIPGVMMNLYRWEENPLQDFMRLFDVSGQWVLQSSQATQENGCALFSNLLYGNYKIDENALVGYYQTAPINPNYFTTPVQSGTNLTFNFLNAQYGSIGDTLYEDTNNNQTQDPGEPGISGVTVELYADDGDGVFEPGTDDSLVDSQATNGDGEYLFPGLVSGDYWVTVDGGLPSELVLTTANDPYLIHLTPGEVDLDADFGYLAQTPEVSLTKTNDHSVGASRGDTVIYTLTLTNGLVALVSVKVTDVLPFGFNYVSGSAKVNNVSSEPSVSGSTLTWNLNNISAGAVLTITYQAKIDDSQQAGIYYNLATCKGLTSRDQSVNCQLVNSSVPIGRTLSYSDFIGGTTNNVLGASTQVLGAATGSETYWLILAILMISGGVVLRRRKGVKNV